MSLIDFLVVGSIGAGVILVFGLIKAAIDDATVAVLLVLGILWAATFLTVPLATLLQGQFVLLLLAAAIITLGLIVILMLREDRRLDARNRP